MPTTEMQSSPAPSRERLTVAYGVDSVIQGSREQCVAARCAVNDAYSTLRAFAITMSREGRSYSARMAADSARDLVHVFAERKPRVGSRMLRKEGVRA